MTVGTCGIVITDGSGSRGICSGRCGRRGGCWPDGCGTCCGGSVAPPAGGGALDSLLEVVVLLVVGVVVVVVVVVVDEVVDGTPPPPPPVASSIRPYTISAISSKTRAPQPASTARLRYHGVGADWASSCSVMPGWPAVPKRSEPGGHCPPAPYCASSVGRLLGSSGPASRATGSIVLTARNHVGLRRRRARQSCRITSAANSSRWSRSARSSSCRYTRCTPAAANGPRRSTISAGVPTSGELERISASSRPMAAARRVSSASSRPAQSTNAAEYVIESGERPTESTASATRWYWAATVSSLANGTLNSSAKVAASAGVRRVPSPPMMIGGCGRCTGLGSAGQSHSA